MRVDGPLVSQALREVPAAARALEAQGYDGTYTFEGPHDPVPARWCWRPTPPSGSS